MKTYAADEIAALVNYIAKLRDDFGVEFVDISQKKETTLDDILASFNTRMDAILEKLKALSTTVEENSAKMEELNNKPAEKVVIYDKTEPADKDTTDKTEPADKDTTDKTEPADKTETPGDASGGENSGNDAAGEGTGSEA